MTGRVKIIGLLGRSRVGKDTVADLIIKDYKQYVKVKLSYTLKVALCELYGFTMKQFESSDKDVVDKRWNKSPRETIQHLTSSMMDFMGKDFFTKRLYDDYDKNKIAPYIIITDIRYNHDIQEIRRRNGLVIKIERPNNSVKYECENHIDSLEGDVTIINDGNIENLHEKIKMYTLFNQTSKNSYSE